MAKKRGKKDRMKRNCGENGKTESKSEIKSGKESGKLCEKSCKTEKKKTAFELYLEIFRSELPLGESFDLLERKLLIGGRRASVFFVDGLHDSDKALELFKYLLAVPQSAMSGITSSSVFLERILPFMEAEVVAVGAAGSSERLYSYCFAEYLQALPKLYAGLVPLVVEGLDDIIIMDARHYPARSVEEPEKEKTLRGAKDGFTETLMTNIGLIRRRIRSNELIFKAYNVGSIGKSDVALVYMKERSDTELVKKLDTVLSAWSKEAKSTKPSSPAYPQQDSTQGQPRRPARLRLCGHFSLHREPSTAEVTAQTLTAPDQSLLERLTAAFDAGSGINPFPKVRYSQRPDVIAAHLTEGKLAIIVDNSPTVMLIPTSIFEFFQDSDDYYFPQLTGNYFRLIRLLNFFVILFLTPVFYLMAEYENFAPEILRFFVPEEAFAIPIFWQFILLEAAVDGLKLASLNTPSSLGTSLSVIGALILGEFSIESGWFIPQTILCMAVVALAAFTQPSIELSYAMKFCRIVLLLGVYLGGGYGLATAAVLVFTVMASTKTLSGGSYLYPLIPFDAKTLKRLIFRTQK